MLALLVVFASTVIAGTLLTPIVIRSAVTRGVYDAPSDSRRVHTQPLPRLGGIAVFIAVLIGLAVSFLTILSGVIAPVGPPSFFVGIMLGGGIIFATGLIDDLRGLGPVSKFIAQCVAALVVYAYGFQVHAVSLGSSQVSLGWFALPVTILWIVGVTNAFNLIDGLDGLATGIALVALTTTLVVSVALGNPVVVFMCVALLGALIGFVRYNFSPARIFLGDSGSLFLGFMLAVLSAHGSMKSATAVMVIVPLFALAIPLLDTALAILRRWLRRVPLSQADGRHIHHRLLAMGLTHRNAVFILYFMASGLAVLGLSLVFAPPPALVSIAMAGGGVSLMVLFYGLRRLQYHEFVEAVSVLATGLGRVRQVIRDRIFAHDIAAVLAEAESMEHVSAILEDNAATFGFLRMEVCRETGGVRPLVLFNGHAARAWKLDYPVTPHDFVEGNDYVLRIWCNPQVGSTPYGAERVAGILAPVLEQWMVGSGPQRVGARAQAEEGRVREGEVVMVTEEHRFPRLERRRIGRGVERG